jgi:hypothetical protein
MTDPLPLKVSAHFPVVRVQCKDVALPFFQCFTEQASMRDENDIGVSRALIACSQEMAAYDSCMQSVFAVERKNK